ncbi:MAG: hypothetical protein LBP59_00230 [Planctomycetaceae bacterium]|jgi:hypothetical protein|nr:hypothetical protein [Planctomycetaceae bacterium]
MKRENNQICEDVNGYELSNSLTSSQKFSNVKMRNIGVLGHVKIGKGGGGGLPV